MTITDGKKEQARDIAKLIMRAMTLECCMHFCGKGHTEEDFYRVMTALVEREDSQYSYKNTLCAIDGEAVVGIIVTYDGGRLRELRNAFLQAAMDNWGIDHSSMPDETEAGELYIDSLAVMPDHENRGIATALVRAANEKARAMNLNLGLLVDEDNAKAYNFYCKIGFIEVGKNSWGGHLMKHLIISH